MQIAIVEDDTDQSDVLACWLSAAGHQPHCFADGASILAALGSGHYDLFVVDWLLPDMQGDELIAMIRERLGWDTPILVATIRDRETDIVAGLQAGADDYLAKPVKHLEFIARVEALGRRLKPRRQPVLKAGIYELDAEQQQARVGGSLVTLTQKELDLAWYLFNNPGKLFSRNHLLDRIWGVDADIDTRTVDTHASRLRRKLALKEDNGFKLESIYGYGYRLQVVESDASLSA
ncbi:MAG: response regulator transcription factor [Wenzhouxiangella sp.]